jgi:hypothetical protein
MRTTSLKSIYLTIPELEEAIARYIRDKQELLEQASTSPGVWSLHAHLMSNEWSMDWTTDGEEFVISIDGEVKDK